MSRPARRSSQGVSTMDSAAACWASVLHGERDMQLKTKTFLMAAAASAGLMAATAHADEWSAYGRDVGGTRFSPLSQITTANVAQLKPAWTFHTGDIADDHKGQ